MSRNPMPSATVSALPASARPDITAAPEVVVRRDLGPWCAAWDELVMMADPPTPFLRSWWLHHVAEGEPCFVLVVAGERLLGGMALQRDRVLGVNRWRSLGGGRFVPDHLQVLVADNTRPEVEARLRGWCRRQGPAIFDLEGLTPDGGFQRILPGAVRTVTEEPSPYLTLTTPDEVVARLPGRLRSTIRRARKKLTAAEVTHRLVPPDELDGALDRLYELHQRRWADGSEFLDGFERFAAAARAGSATGEVLLHELRRGTEVLAVQVDLRTADGVSFFQAGRDTESDLPSLGTVLLATAIEHACREGASAYDLLRGRQPYKQDWATAEHPVVRLRSAVGIRARTALRLTIGRKRVGALKGRLRRSLVDHREARRSDAGPEVAIIRDAASLPELREPWNELTPDIPSPSSQLDWMIAYAATMPADEALHLVTIREHGRLDGVAPLVRRRGRLVLPDQEAAGFLYRDERHHEQLIDAVLSLRRPLVLPALPADGRTSALLSERAHRRQLLHVRPWAGGPSIPLDERWKDPMTQLSTGRQTDLRRSARRAATMGETRYELITGDGDLERAFDELVEVEGRSWKARAGTALVQDDRQRQLLHQYVTAPGVRKAARVARMYIGRTLVASELGVIVGNRYWGLKIGYDKRFRRISPGLHLMVELVGVMAAEGIDRFELMGEDAPYKQMWGHDPTPLQHVTSYPPGAAGVRAFTLDATSKLRRSLKRRLEGRRSDARAAHLAMRRPGVEIPSRNGTVQVLDDPDDLERLRVEWQRLEADVPGPSSQLDWVLTYVRAAAEPDCLRALTIRHEGRLTAVAPLERQGRIVPRLKLVILSASGLRYRDEPQLARLVDALLGLRLPLSLDLLPVGSPGERLLQERRRCTRVVRSSERMGGPSLPLDETWRQPLDHLSPSTRKSLRRRRRQAEALGALRFEHLAPGRDLAQLRELFDEFVELEASGWKGRAGTAMATDACRREMMWQHIRAQDVREQIRVGRMTIDGRLVAGYLGWQIDDHYWSAKAAYDEAYAHLSPGQLAMAYEIESAAREGATRFEMGGKHEPYKAKWGDGQPLRSIAIYPPSAAGAAAVVVDGTRRLHRRGSALVQRRSAEAQAGGNE